jgi:NCS1 family nucleobase:cation symporter-1
VDQSGIPFGVALPDGLVGLAVAAGAGVVLYLLTYRLKPLWVRDAPGGTPEGAGERASAVVS